MSSVTEHFWWAALNGQLAEVRRVLREHPEVNVNWKRGGQSALHVSCAKGHDHVVGLLLSLPKIDVNHKDGGGMSPFGRACLSKKVNCIDLMMRDPRVVLDCEDRFFTFVYQGDTEIAKRWMASGKGFDIRSIPEMLHILGKFSEYYSKEQNEGRAKLRALLTLLMENPGETRNQLRVELGWWDLGAVDFFAIVVFLCDGLVEIGNSQENPEAARFLKIACQLPLELQMTLCHRVVRSRRNLISARNSELAFKALAKTFVAPPSS